MYNLIFNIYNLHKQLSGSSLVFTELYSEYKILRKEAGNEV